MRTAVLERRAGAATAAYCSRGEDIRSADARAASGTVSTTASPGRMWNSTAGPFRPRPITSPSASTTSPERSEEHTSELQSRLHLVCRLLLEKKKKKKQANKPKQQLEIHN